MSRENLLDVLHKVQDKTVTTREAADQIESFMSPVNMWLARDSSHSVAFLNKSEADLYATTITSMEVKELKLFKWSDVNSQTTLKDQETALS